MAQIPHERSLVKRLAGKPFALIGVNTDEDREELKKVVKQEKITWRSFWDGSPFGPINKAWSVNFLPVVYVLDHKGVIRFKYFGPDVKGPSMDRAINGLLEEMAQSASGKP